MRTTHLFLVTRYVFRIEMSSMHTGAEHASITRTFCEKVCSIDLNNKYNFEIRQNTYYAMCDQTFLSYDEVYFDVGKNNLHTYSIGA